MSSPKRPRPFRDPSIERSLLGAAEAGVKILKKHHGAIGKIDKKGAVNLVTVADREAEAKVLRYLKSRHPDHTFIAEESWDGKETGSSGYSWILDPLDGTTNYAHGLDHYAFSLAVALDGDPVAGIVVDPSRDHVYTAFKGRGAFLGRKRLRVSSVRRLADSLLVTGFPYDRRRHLPELMAVYAAFLKRTHDVRRFGVAALDLALVASGQFDGYYEPSLYAWDIAAGMLLVSEAGGKLSDYEGNPLHPFSVSLVAAPPVLHRSILRVVRATLKEVPRTSGRRA